MALDKEFYDARSKLMSAKQQQKDEHVKAEKEKRQPRDFSKEIETCSSGFAEIKHKCVAAGYDISSDNHLTATGKVKDAPPAPSAELAKAKFEGDSKGIKPSKKSDA